jgi:hypothetical protein
LWVGAENLNCALSGLRHEVNGAVLVDDHGLANYLSSLAYLYLLELTIILLEVWVVFLLCFGRQGEANRQLFGRCDAVVDDAIIVLSDECNVEATR